MKYLKKTTDGNSRFSDKGQQVELIHVLFFLEKYLYSRVLPILNVRKRRLNAVLFDFLSRTLEDISQVYE